MTARDPQLTAAVAAEGALPMPAGPVRLTAEREAEIRERAPKRTAEFTAWLNAYSPLPGGDAADDAEAVLEEDVPALLAELNAVRAERDQARRQLDARTEDIAFLERNTLPELRRTVEHHKDGKERWRERAEKAEARVAELEAASEPVHFGICFTNVRGHRLVNGHCLYCGMSAGEATS